MRVDADKLKSAIRTGAGMLASDIPWADPLALLGALAENESSFGLNNRARFEKAFSEGGLYCQGDQKARFDEWGALAACSYSSFQILYCSACELGFDVSPWHRSPTDLFDDNIAIMFVVEYIKKRILPKGVKDVNGFARVYNSGSLLNESAGVLLYAELFEKYYLDVVERRGLKFEAV